MGRLASCLTPIRVRIEEGVTEFTPDCIYVKCTAYSFATRDKKMADMAIVELSKIDWDSDSILPETVSIKSKRWGQVIPEVSRDT